ncbi:hypothetical protein [Archangium sp.]|jgi:Tol biopolymer transport system component|uniref:hypothetical protein n=1 Tax=Archangium sp. TaxID=1872627 RepID=UPI002EDB89B5
MLRTLIPLACLVPALAFAQNAGFPLRGKSLVVNNGPGDQTDPHVSGPVVAYTHQLSLSSSEIRVHDLVTGEDQAIPTEGGYDSLADVSGDTVVFTRTTGSSRVFRFNVRQGGAAQELAPREGADRRVATIGGQTVAWQELGSLTRSEQPEIFAYRLDSLALTRLSEDTSVDRTPAVSVDGTTVAWTKCATSIDGCDIWAAYAVEGGYQVAQLTGTEGEESQPDTNGEVVAYVTRRTVDGVTEADIAWQAVRGGETRRLPLPGPDSNPNVSGPLIAFERREASSTSPNFDIMLYDLRTQTFYRLTETPESESLNDISVEPDGLARVVWSVRENGDLNVYAYTFRLPPTDCAPPIDEAPEAVCASPGTRPLLGGLQVTRSTGKPEVLSTRFVSKGTGVLCVDNGFEGTPATTGRVWLGPVLSVGPEDFGHDVKGLAQALSLQGETTLSAQVQGAPGSAFRVRVYGESSCELPPLDDGLKGAELLHGQFVPSEPVGAGAEKTLLSRYFVPSGYEGVLESSSGEGTGGAPVVANGTFPPLSEKPLAGCSAGGGPVALLGVWMLAALLFRHGTGRARRQAPVTSRR